MDKLEAIIEDIHTAFEAKTAARDHALGRARLLTRNCAHAIRAIHRSERTQAETMLVEARQIADALRQDLAGYPDLYYAGYTQDALKEFGEASIAVALITHGALPTPADLNLEYDTYLKGMAEAVGELRRRCLDALRDGYSSEAERLLECVDDIYTVLVTIDYPDAITGGLRRLTDIVRSLVERTRGDLTISQRQWMLEKAMQKLEDRLDENYAPEV
jgi:translin